MTLAEFLLALANDRELLARYEADPRAILDEFGIEGETANLLLAGKLRDLRVKIEGELEVDGETVSFFTIWWFRQGPPRP
jgi:hypothetical protein